MQQIKFENRLFCQNGSRCLISVDGTDFHIYEPTPFWKGWFSHKFNGPALRYEVSICIQTGWIVWIKGPFVAGHWSDIKIFQGWLKTKLLPDEFVEADRGYRGDDKMSAPDDDAPSLYHFYSKGNVRARHETVNRRFKQFNCLHHRFRHDKEKHALCFDAVAVLTQLSIQSGEPLYDVEYKSG